MPARRVQNIEDDRGASADCRIYPSCYFTCQCGADELRTGSLYATIPPPPRARAPADGLRTAPNAVTFSGHLEVGLLPRFVLRFITIESGLKRVDLLQTASARVTANRKSLSRQRRVWTNFPTIWKSRDLDSSGRTTARCALVTPQERGGEASSIEQRLIRRSHPSESFENPR